MIDQEVCPVVLGPHYWYTAGHDGETKCMNCGTILKDDEERIENG